MAATDDPPDPGDAVAPEPLFEPFARLLSFAERPVCRAIEPKHVRQPIEPIEPLDTTIDQLVDFEALEKLTQWQGFFRAPTTMPEDKYPVEMEERMGEREPQFVLRNLARVEKHADPDERLAVEPHGLSFGLPDEVTSAARTLAEHSAPELLPELNGDVVRERQTWMRWLRTTARWDSFFGAEVKRSIDGPQWRQGPNDGEDERTAGDGDGSEDIGDASA